MKYCVLITLMSTLIRLQGQSNFTFTPAKPQAGEDISITYTPAGVLANQTEKIQAIGFFQTNGKSVAHDLPLTRKGNAYVAAIKTDTAINFIQLGFYVDKDKYPEFDSNFNNGYHIQLY